METQNSKAAALAKQIRGLVATYDECGSLVHTVEGQRRHMLAQDKMGESGHQERIATLNRQLNEFIAAKSKVEAQLGKLLGDVRDAVKEMAGAKPDSTSEELLALLGNDAESALVRCEKAAEFIELKLAAQPVA